jgi:hypothetical protein
LVRVECAVGGRGAALRAPLAGKLLIQLIGQSNRADIARVLAGSGVLY